MNKKVSFHTLGCKLNFSETSSIGNQFLKKGYDVLSENRPADIYVINTCSVTESAEKECRQIVRRFLRQNPEAFIIVTGCYAQLRPDEIAGIEGVDAVLGSNEKFRIFEIIDSFEKKSLSCIHVSATEELNDFNFAASSNADSRTRAFFKIQDGCDYPCTYCTIPLARGKSRSVAPGLVIENFKKLLSNGYREIILTGVNLGDYGKNSSQDFYFLLKEIVKIPGDFRVRISSIEPNLLTDEILELIKNNNKICNHLHIPLQSGSTKILKLMKRRYNTKFYKDLVHKVLEKIPDAGIGVDVIVGFPGETDEDFRETYDFIKELPVSYLHVFTYSERPDTPASEFEGSVDVFERKKRNNMLRILSEKKTRQFYEKMNGKTLCVLFEGEDHDGIMKGFASNYVRVKYEYNNNLPNEFAEVRITGVDGNICTAEILNTKEINKSLAV